MGRAGLHTLQTLPVRGVLADAFMNDRKLPTGWIDHFGADALKHAEVYNLLHRLVRFFKDVRRCIWECGEGGGGRWWEVGWMVCGRCVEGVWRVW